MLADRLRELDVTDVAVHLPDAACFDRVVDACRAAGKRVVSIDASSRIVITADGVASDGVVRCLKDEVDAIVPGAEHVFVLRLIGDAPLAPTMDAYLDVEMRDGRDVWVDALD